MEGFKLCAISEFHSTNKDKFTSSNRYDFYSIFWIKEGCLTISIDFIQTKINKSGFIFIGKNRIWAIDHIENCKGIFLKFTDDFFCKTAADTRFLQRCIVFDTLESPYVNLHDATNFISDLYVLLEQEAFSNKEFCNDIIRMQLKTLMLLAEREINLRSVDGYINQEEFKQTRIFKRLVEDHFTEIKVVKKYAELMIFPEKKLITSVQKVMGYSPKQLLNKRIILEAKRLLIYCSFNIKEIANHLGFKEDTNFIKFFKQQTGKTPFEFRKENHPFK